MLEMSRLSRGQLDGGQQATANSCVQTEKRCMVDYKMYQRLHPTKQMFGCPPHKRNKELMNSTEPPEDDLLLCLPSMIIAFEFSKKAWSK